MINLACVPKLLAGLSPNSCRLGYTPQQAVDVTVMLSSSAIFGSSNISLHHTPSDDFKSTEYHHNVYSRRT